VDETTLDVLVNGASKEDASPKKTIQQSSPPKPLRQKWSAQAVPFVPKQREQTMSATTTGIEPKAYHSKDWQLPTPDSTTPEEFGELDYDVMNPAKMMSGIQQYGHGQDWEQDEEEVYDINREDRSVVLKGISPFTTMADVLAVVRGGAVLNIYLRPQQRTAHVAFVEPYAAEKFLIHSRRTDVYIKGKRVCGPLSDTKFLLTRPQMEVFYDDRQHFLPGYLARRIHNNGATRNLVIRYAKADMTEESIREDLEHIYRLEVVSCHFEFGHAWLSLNSVQQAVTARSCMGSRFKYKGCRIEFYPDECTEPLPPYVKRQPQSKPATLRSKKSNYNFNNKFATLTVEDDNRSSIGIGSPVRVHG
jgi:hypothetical protein